jgi:hypothetical protein
MPLVFYQVPEARRGFLIICRSITIDGYLVLMYRKTQLHIVQPRAFHINRVQFEIKYKMKGATEKILTV